MNIHPLPINVLATTLLVFIFCSHFSLTPKFVFRKKKMMMKRMMMKAKRKKKTMTMKSKHSGMKEMRYVNEVASRLDSINLTVLSFL